MKKTLIAMAVLAASGASFAQVTLYGVVDGGYGVSKTSVTSTTGGGVTTTTDTRNDGIVSNGAIGNDRWGIKGTEELGGGLKANFVLEGSAATVGGGTNTAGQLFDRDATVGLSGGFGAVRIGRSYTPLYKTLAASDVFETTGISTVNLNPAAGTRASNAVFYNTPSLGGFNLAAMYGTLDTGSSVSTGATTPIKTTNSGLNAGYAAGPLSVMLGFGWQDVDAAGPVTSKNTGSALSFSYDFGAVKLFAGYTQGRAKADTSLDSYIDNNETNLGVSVPLGAVTLMAAVGRNSQTTVTNSAEVAATTGNGNDWTLGAYYNLSKRTVAFVKTGVYDKFSFGTTAGTTGGNNKDTTASTIGIRHSF